MQQLNSCVNDCYILLHNDQMSICHCSLDNDSGGAGKIARL